MLSAKRVFVTTLFGFIFGFICMFLASSGDDPSLTCSIKYSIVFSRGLMGFLIGVSALKLQWWLHGLILGGIASIPMAIPIFPDYKIAISTIIMGMIYGLLIELFATLVFKVKPVSLDLDSRS